LPAPTSPALGKPGNMSSGLSGKSCPKGKRKVTKNGKTRCVKKRHHKHRRHRAGSRKGVGK
jgi:hypothetical protein